MLNKENELNKKESAEYKKPSSFLHPEDVPPVSTKSTPFTSPLVTPGGPTQTQPEKAFFDQNVSQNSQNVTQSQAAQNSSDVPDAPGEVTESILESSIRGG